MSVEELQNSPLHGLSTETMLTELVEFYGWAVLDAAIDLKCFRIQPTIPSCLTFLKKAAWARNRVEEFYLYCFKGMPKSGDLSLFEMYEHPNTATDAKINQFLKNIEPVFRTRI